MAVDRSLSTQGTAELVLAGQSQLTRTPPSPGDELPAGGFIFGGPASGTIAMVLDEQGIPGPRQRVPGGLPVTASVDAARASGDRGHPRGDRPDPGPQHHGDGVSASVTETPVRVLTEPGHGPRAAVLRPDRR